MSNQQNDAKRAAARRVIQDFVFDGMTLGLGSGTTSHFFVRELGQHVAKGLQLTCTTTSRATSEVARDVGIELSDPNEMNEIDLTIDGPDEIDRRFNMIKGGGACLLWEKIIAHASKRMICICDETKIVNCLGAISAASRNRPLCLETDRTQGRAGTRGTGSPSCADYSAYGGRAPGDH